MSLTEADLRAAREFRDSQRAALRRKGAPDITVSALIRHYRHGCASRGGKSVNLELREHYVFSPEYVVAAEGGRIIGVAVLGTEEISGEMPDGAWATGVPARRFGFIFTEGRCPACGTTARSGDSRLVDPAIRPPSPRAVIRG